MTGPVAIGVMALVLSAVLTPVAARVARRLGVLDRPGPRKLHAAPMPLLGGAAVLASAVLALAAWGTLPTTIVGPALLVFATGLVDDVRKDALSARSRLLLETAAAGWAVLAGVHTTFLPGVGTNEIVSAVFLVGLANASNLLDNMNGLCAGSMAAAAFFIGLAALREENAETTSILFAIAGGALGFLPHNYPRARVFIGDAGSLSLGFWVAAGAILEANSAERSSSPARWLAPLCALGLPLLDTGLVICSRVRRGVPVMQGDRTHLSHRLERRGTGPALAVAILFGAGLGLGGISLWIRATGSAAPAVAAAAMGVALLAVAGRLRDD